jgi:hypothetical protein
MKTLATHYYTLKKWTFGTDCAGAKATALLSAPSSLLLVTWGRTVTYTYSSMGMVGVDRIILNLSWNPKKIRPGKRAAVYDLVWLLQIVVPP